MDGGWVVAGPREFGVDFWSYQCHRPLGVNGWGIMFDGMLVCLDRGGKWVNRTNSIKISSKGAKHTESNEVGQMCSLSISFVSQKC
jgi:hypothetical protein